MNISGTILLESKIQPETLYQKQQVSRQNLLFICIFKCFSEQSLTSFTKYISLEQPVQKSDSGLLLLDGFGEKVILLRLTCLSCRSPKVFLQHVLHRMAILYKGSKLFFKVKCPIYFFQNILSSYQLMPSTFSIVQVYIVARKYNPKLYQMQNTLGEDSP